MRIRLDGYKTPGAKGTRCDCEVFALRIVFEGGADAITGDGN
tara:strand:+ start:636 stop:761 length:126 start_codon:yes stop_codon:yes gene_type:complete